ncbi:MAG: translation initiation factor IF-2 [Candidatus Doudnabacteria bacterium]|nr:translation initiation factor IF-2 [Candidatus Doudnabacteria bacterium]
MDISTLSKQLNIPVQQLRFKMNAAGFRISPKANKIDNQIAKQVLAAFSQKPRTETIVKNKDISLPKVLTVKELAAILGMEVTTVIKQLIQNGVMATINEEIDYDTAAIVASDLGFNVSETVESSTRLGLGYVEEVLKAEMASNPLDFVTRASVVAIMGHVDHGKTTLLDTIRKTKVVETEAGRITQHIGAYQIAKNNKQITFLDTPGHEAFAAMRARGANVTDIIVLVVAADDGVKPQTIEVINRAKITETPLIVAVNKIDRPDANIERVKKELGEYGVLIEEWGGRVPLANISASTGQGVEELLDLILLQAEVLDLKANPKGQTLGTVIESHVSKTLGPVATVLVQNGTLNLGESVAVGRAFGKVRAMIDAKGHRVKNAGPSTPVQITGFSDSPDAGDILKTYQTPDEAKIAASAVLKSERAKKFQTTSKLSVEGKDLNLIFKVDVAGSLEAINEALDKLKNTEVKLNIIDQGVGEINDNDILRAEAANAVVVGFHTKLSPQAAKLSQSKQVTVRLYDIIYELIEDLTRQIVEMMTPEVVRTDLGRAKILAVFRTEKERMIVGGTVVEGKIKVPALVQIKRGDQIMGPGEILELQQNKTKTREVLAGFEFGISVRTDVKIEAGDTLIIFEESIKKKSL